MKDFTTLIATLVAFIITAVLGKYMIPFLKKLKFGQTIREDGPTWHGAKQGTPTMGGLMMIGGFISAVIISVAFAAVFSTRFNYELKNSMYITRFIASIGLGLGMGFIGFIDDYIKVVKKRNLGLTARQKTFFQLLIAACYLISLYLGGMTVTWLPFAGYVDITRNAGIIFWPIALIYIYFFTNAVNLTDGIDGLCSSVTLVVSCAFLLAGGLLNVRSDSVLAAALAGVCVGFLIWNAHPAKVFMGDTGSLFLGGMVVALSFCIDRPVLLIFAGIIYLIEAFSVVLQVAWYKKTRKRIFKMSPIHHHFEMCGWSEEKIVLSFSIVTFAGCLISLLPALFRW